MYLIQLNTEFIKVDLPMLETSDFYNNMHVFISVNEKNAFKMRV